MNFSQAELRTIVEQASSISERLTTNFTPNNFQENNALVNSNLEKWCQLIALGNWEKFQQRLAWDGLDISTAKSILGFVKINKDVPLPSWTTTLNECVEASSTFKLDVIKNQPCLNPKEPLPFEEIWLPFIYVAQKKLINKVESKQKLLSNEVYTSLKRSLLEWLTHLSSLTLELEFSAFRATKQSTIQRFLQVSNQTSSKQNYQLFVEELLTKNLCSFFKNYPVLARLISISIDMWIENISEFIIRLKSDFLDIKEVFFVQQELGQVVAINTNLSDRHDNGNSVMKVTFASGLKLVYKPKNLDLEENYFNLLKWINDHELSLPFKILKVLNRSNYGWVEFAETIPCYEKESAKRYYQRIGMLICLTHILYATDLHCDNIIAHSEHPILIDLETLLHPWFESVNNTEISCNARSLANQQLWNSGIRTGIIPQWQVGLTGQTYDDGGLRELCEQKTEDFFAELDFSNVNTDTMLHNYKIQYKKPKIQKPFRNVNNLLLTDCTESIIDGFQEMYLFFIKHRKEILASDSPLTQFSHNSVRFIFRNTGPYKYILESTREPKFMKNGAERSIQIELIRRGISFLEEKPLFWPIFNLEQQSLENLDIPLFKANSNSSDLTLTDNQTISNYFIEPIFNLVISRINQLSDEDLDKQINFIKGSLFAYTANEFEKNNNRNKKLSFISHQTDYKVTKSLLTRSDILQQANLIATDLQKQAISSRDGTVTWITPQYIFKTERFQFQPMEDQMFDGTYGVALFLSALEKVSGGSGFRHLALGALQSFRQNLHSPDIAYIVEKMGIGGAIGCGSIIYTLVRISQFLEEPTLVEDAVKLASMITPKLIGNDQEFDIISGTAGMILGLLTLRKVGRIKNILDMAINCGDHLLKHRVTSHSGYRTWKTINGKPLTGFSHGASGIAYALLRLYNETQETRFLEAAKEAIAYENSVFTFNAGNWPDFRSTSTESDLIYQCNWAHGATGIGLARVAGLDILDTPEIRHDISIALKTTKEYGLHGFDDLCNGNFGRIEFLFTTDQKLIQPELRTIAMTQATEIINRSQYKGYSPSLGYNYLGFFTGASGIGYQLLRLAYPDELPSVLLWE